MIDDIFLATLVSTLRELGRSPVLQGTTEVLWVEALAARVEREAAEPVGPRAEVLPTTAELTETSTARLLSQTREVLGQCAACGHAWDAHEGGDCYSARIPCTCPLSPPPSGPRADEARELGLLS